MEHYERRLPHWDTVGRLLFVTFRLWGSLPRGRVFPPASIDSGKAFVAMDRLLDMADTGPLFLRMPEIAGFMVDALKAGQQRFERYDLHSVVVNGQPCSHPGYSSCVGFEVVGSFEGLYRMPGKPDSWIDRPAILAGGEL